MNRKNINKWINLFGVILWACIIPAAILLGWIYSVAFISVASIYANMASHWAAWRADDDELQESLDRLCDLVQELLDKQK